jgi:hypothetical protein
MGNMEARTRKRIAAWAAAGMVTIWIPVAIDQAYFRYNAYVLPLVGFGVALLYAGLILTSPAVSGKIHAFHNSTQPLRYMLSVAGIGGLLLLLLGGGEWYAIHESRQHVAELRRADTTKPTPAAVPQSTSPLPQSPPVRPEGKEGSLLPKPKPLQSAPQPSVVQNNNQGINIGPGATAPNATVNNYAPLQRHLTAEQISGLSVIDCPKGSNVAIVWEPDSEATAFAGDFVGAIRCVGYRASLKSKPPLIAGLTLVSPDWEIEPAKSIRAAMQVTGVNFISETGSLMGAQLSIVVGIRP